MKNTYFAAIVFILSFLFYWLTLAPGLNFTDSGELASVSVTLGIAHPTGYPLFTLLTHLWALILPFEEIYSLNIFAAFTTALSASILYLTLRLILSESKVKKRIANFISKATIEIVATSTALIYAFGIVIWSQATSIEVYSLQLLLINIIFYFLLKAYFSTDYKVSVKYFMMSAFILGLAFANHLTTVVLLPGIIFLYYAKSKSINSKFDLKIFSYLILVSFIGISLYLYLPIRSSMAPDFNWGEVHRSFDKFWYHVSGKQYQVWMFESATVWKENFSKFISLLPGQITWVGIFFFFHGLIIAFKSDKKLAITFLLFMFSCLFYSFNYSIHDIDTYFSPAFIIITFFIGLSAWSFVNKKKVLVYIFPMLVLIHIANNYKSADESQNYMVEEYNRLVQESAEENSIIISAQWDYWVSAFWYSNKVRGQRQDIALIEKELLRRTWYVNQLKRWYPDIAEKSKLEIDNYLEQLELFESGEKYDPRLIQARFVQMINSFIDKNINERPVYITADVVSTDAEIAAKYQKYPQGLIIELSKKLKNHKIEYEHLNFEKFLLGAYKNNHLVDGIKKSALYNLHANYKYAESTEQINAVEKIREQIYLFNN